MSLFNWTVLSVFLILNGILVLKKDETGADFNVRIVQANIGNFLKVSSEKGDENSFEEINKDYQRLSTAQNGFKPDLIVWPETAFSGTFYGRKVPVPFMFAEIMMMEQTEMLIGGYEQDPTKSPFDNFETIFNSALLLEGTFIKEAYHKNILIPFGETLPLGPLTKFVAEIVPAISLFAHGKGTPIMETKAKHRFVTPICYEILNTDYMRYLLNQHKGNSFIANLTNDSWYGDTAEPHQHQFLSKWRALEFQLPIIRSTNTGISSVIFPDGSESKRMGVGEKNFLDVSMKLKKTEETFYQKFGILPLLSFMLTIGAIIFALKKNGSRP